MRRRLALSACALALFACTFAGGSELASGGSATWTERFDGFGSYSGIVVSADGTAFTAVSDKGSHVTGTLQRQGGMLTGVTALRHGPLLDPDGNAVRGRDVDAEGLARGPDGTLHVSFEARHRVWSYPDIAGPAVPLPRHPDADRLQNNSGLEALAIDGDGALMAIPERSGRLDRPFPITRFADGRWTHWYHLRRDGPFLVTGADFGPDGALYLLERHFAGIGFQSRIRRFVFGPDGVAAEETLMQSRTGRYDNLEGISVWRDTSGAIRITTISDDNGSFFQRTEVVEFVLPPD